MVGIFYLYEFRDLMEYFFGNNEQPPHCWQNCEFLLSIVFSCSPQTSFLLIPLFIDLSRVNRHLLCWSVSLVFCNLKNEKSKLHSKIFSAPLFSLHSSLGPIFALLFCFNPLLLIGKTMFAFPCWYQHHSCLIYHLAYNIFFLLMLWLISLHTLGVMLVCIHELSTAGRRSVATATK